MACAGNVLSASFHGEQVQFKVLAFSTQQSSQEVTKVKSNAATKENADSSVLERLSHLSLTSSPFKSNGFVQTSLEEQFSSPCLNRSTMSACSSSSTPVSPLEMTDNSTASPKMLAFDSSSLSDELRGVFKPVPPFHLGRISLQTRLTFAGSTGDQVTPLSGCPTFADVGGLDVKIQLLRELLLFPLSAKETAHLSWRTESPRGLLLHGPAGSGKTLLARSALREASCRYKIFLTVAEILQEGLECDQKLKEVFEDARKQAPSLVVIDDLDALCPRRELGASESEKRAIMSLASAMDTLCLSSAYVMVLATTSKIEAVDSHLRRPGRFDCEIEISAPSSSQRWQILSLLLAKFPNNLSQEEVAELSDRAHGHVGSDLRAVCQEAWRLARGRTLSASKGVVTKPQDVLIHFKDMTTALKSVAPSALREVAVEVPKVCKLNACSVVKFSAFRWCNVAWLGNSLMGGWVWEGSPCVGFSSQLGQPSCEVLSSLDPSRQRPKPFQSSLASASESRLLASSLLNVLISPYLAVF